MSAITNRDRPASNRTVSVKSFVSGLSKLNTIGTKPRSRSLSRNFSRTSILPSVKRPNRRTPLFPIVSMTSDLLVMEQKVNKLRDLDAIDGDLGLPEVSDEQ